MRARSTCCAPGTWDTQTSTCCDENVENACVRLASPLNTCHNIMQQCCKMLRWNVASVCPGLLIIPEPSTAVDEGPLTSGSTALWNVQLITLSSISSVNGPFPSCCLSRFRSECWCSTIQMEISFRFAYEYATHFHLNGCAPGLALKLRHAVTRKWAICDA